MTNMITLNVKTRVNLREVCLIERVLAKDIERLAAKTGLPPERLKVFQSNVRFLNGSNILATQSFEEISARADHRFIAVRMEEDGEGGTQAAQLVPMDAIRHFEMVSADDRQAMKTRYPDTTPEKIDALKTRITYFEFDPESINGGKPNFYQKMFPVDLKNDLAQTQALDFTDIGHGRFVLSDEITDARDLSEAELKSLARKYNVRSEKDGDLTTSVTLRSGDLIMSSFPAANILGKPQGTPRPVRLRGQRPVRQAALK